MEYNPKQAFTGINMPLELHLRPQLHKPEAAKKAEAAAQPAVVFSLDESSQGHATPLSILYGSDGGSTTELAERVMETAQEPHPPHRSIFGSSRLISARLGSARLGSSRLISARPASARLGSAASGHLPQELGFAPTVKPLNEAIGDPALGTDGLLLVLSATYNGCPPANAGDFVNFCGAAIERHERPVDARFAVLGCGHSDWADTFQARSPGAVAARRRRVPRCELPSRPARRSRRCSTSASRRSEATGCSTSTRQTRRRCPARGGARREALA